MEDGRPKVRIVQMGAEHLEGVVALQKLIFPPPFSEDLHWDVEYLEIHLSVYPEGQWVALDGDQVIGSCSNCRTSDERWKAHKNWWQAVDGPAIKGYDPNGPTLYGMDIGVHPGYRKQGIGRAFYERRFAYVREHSMARFGTACRIPDYSQHRELGLEGYVNEVVSGRLTDRTLSPLLRYGLTCLGVKRDYLPDPESDDAAAALEWLNPFDVKVLEQ